MVVNEKVQEHHESMKRLLVIDALNMFLRSYIVNPTISKDGRPIGGTAGLFKSCLQECFGLRV